MQITKFYTDQNISTFSTVVGFSVWVLPAKKKKIIKIYILVLHVYLSWVNCKSEEKRNIQK